MGKLDSSKTRVVPVFDELRRRDPLGEMWLERLLSLPTGVASRASRTATPPIRESRWGEEKSLHPPMSLLRWMIDHPNQLTKPADFEKRSQTTQEKRSALLNGDPATREEALRLLEGASAPTSVWYVLEGHTRPDAFLATDDALIVVEGKRTERGATTTTTWLADRSQMLRHLDCAWDIREGRRVYGFYVVEAEDGVAVPSKWWDEVAETVAERTRKASPPHRSPETQETIADGFLGVCTWQHVCREFDIEL